MLARHLDVPYDEVRFKSRPGSTTRPGSPEFRPRRTEGPLPAPARGHERGVTCQARTCAPGPDDRGEHSEASRGASIYEGAAGVERVRTELMAAFGYFHTESSHHASEYVPYFRKNPELVDAFIPQRWDYYEICSAHDGPAARELLAAQEGAEAVEYGALIVNRGDGLRA